MLKNEKVQLLMDKQAQMKRDQNWRVAIMQVSHAAGILVESQIGGTEKRWHARDDLILQSYSQTQ
ncbi:uncharacterized protein N7469_006190 [Penicillium citrinum]|uniref:Uncharacterized protein n=1 Tax=Penicillium citrinum TaxID=5077 RepID=A0A9W9NXM0_PENCI|nr:uncharacterized protein N7469_006190 [Penicillium citrinum]KAJ5231602.1 hypothetical protein N7469_006190 [Penicillium citrinum]